MKKLLFVLLAIAAASCTKDTKTTLRFKIRDFDGNNPRVVIGWINQSVNIDSAGKGELVLDLKKPTYATVNVRKYDKRLCFLEPGKDLTFSYSMKKGEKDVAYDGDLAPVAQFLNQNDFYAITPINYLSKNIVATVQKADSILSENMKKLENTSYSATFKEWEAKRLQAEEFAALLRAPLLDTNAYLSTLNNKLSTDSTFLDIPAYRDALDQYIRRLVSISQKGKILEGTNLADARLKCIFENIKEPAAISYLVDLTLFHLGESGIEKYEQIYNRYVKDPERLARYTEACKKADRIAPGQPCPDFSFQNNQGETISLADLKGKFVYIDMWATWCGPCKGEMPSLLKLEEEFAGQDILFVSLSVDRNKDIELWKKTIKEMGLGGIQLHLGENWEWLKIFMPASISVPRFVLLDREGKIINANMSRPSDKTTAEKFRELLNAQN